MPPVAERHVMGLTTVRRLAAVVVAVVAVAGGCSCSTKPFVESSAEVEVTLTAAEPAVEGDLILRINDRVRGRSWDPEGDPEATSLDDWFDLQVDLSPRVAGVRVSLVPVEGPGSLVVSKGLRPANGVEGVPVDDWFGHWRTSFIGGGTFDFACPVLEPCELAFRYRIEHLLPLEADELVEVAAQAVLSVEEQGPGGRRGRPDGAEMTVTMHPPTASAPIIEPFELGTVSVAGRMFRGKVEVPVTIRYENGTESEVMRFVTSADPEVRFVQDHDVITYSDGRSALLPEVPLMVGDCDADGCLIEGRLVAEVEPDSESVTFWAYLRDGFSLHGPPSGIEFEVDLAPEALPPPKWVDTSPAD